jgi:hypothetical protein
LEKQPNAKLRVYTIWLIGLGGERRSNWNPDAMPDLRVLHFWDAERFAGSWFAKEVQGEPGYAWDTYFLYGPDATWNQTPGPLLRSGRTIIDTGPELRNKLAPLIKE